jgi:hypothetical protein
MPYKTFSFLSADLVALPHQIAFSSFTSLFAPCIFIELSPRNLPTIMNLLMLKKISYKIISAAKCFGVRYHHHQEEILHCKLEHR